MQQMLIEEEEEIEYAMYVESGAIQPKIVGKRREEKREWQKYYRSQQKTIKDSELLAGLFKHVQCIVPRKARK